MKNQKTLVIQYLINKEISSRAPKLLLFKKRMLLKNNLKFFKFYSMFNFYFYLKFFFFKFFKIKNFFISPIKTKYKLNKINNKFNNEFYNLNFITLFKNNSISLICKNKFKNNYNSVFFFQYIIDNIIFKCQFMYIFIYI